jgi:hypothetical protein
MVLAAAQTYRHGRARREEVHRRWAIRLFALAIGSWLYRMDYGFWLLFTGGAGHTQAFSGPFDVAMAFAFYVPNLVVAEVFLRAGRAPTGAIFRGFAAAMLFSATALVAIGTYFFVLYYWGPGIVQTLAGSPAQGG